MNRVADPRQELQEAKQDVLLELNARVYEAAKRFEDDEPEQELWEFTCECGEPDCRSSVSLSLPRYERLRLAEQPILAMGHETQLQAHPGRVDSPA